MRPRGDEGFALLVVMGAMITLCLVVLATLGYIANSLPQTRRNQEGVAALQAAQAGIDDYLARLTTCDSYWADRCGAAANSNVAVAGWADVPFSSAATPAQYHYDVLKTPNDITGLLRIRSTGRVKSSVDSSKRTLTVDLNKESLLRFVYYTDHESSDPSSIVERYPTRVVAGTGANATRYNGVTSAEAEKCNRYWYPFGGQPARPANTSQQFKETYQYSTDGGKRFGDANTQWYSCDIQFGPKDTIDGDAYTKDAILLNNPLFKGVFRSRWPSGSTSPGPTASRWYRLTDGGADPQAAGFKPSYADADVTLPPSNVAIKDKTDPAKGGQKGCPYTGPTRILLNSDATMTVTSPLTRSTNAGCGIVTPSGISTQKVSLPQNGVVFVESSTEGCSGKPTAFALPTADLTPYSCSAGDVFIEGTLSGALTIAARNDIVVTGNTTYKNGTSGSDVLGLIANGDVAVYHPVKCASTPASEFVCNDFDNIDVGLTNLQISGALLSVNHSFTVQNYNRGEKLGVLTLKGGLYQYFRGPVATSNSGVVVTGYEKNYLYDARLRSLPPPSFIDPVAAPWAANTYAEVRPPPLCKGTQKPPTCVPA